MITLITFIIVDTYAHRNFCYINQKGVALFSFMFLSEILAYIATAKAIF